MSGKEYILSFGVRLIVNRTDGKSVEFTLEHASGLSDSQGQLVWKEVNDILKNP